ncbi:MAG: hypothetical protein FJ292_02580 [Planctomycetes bacterium]|nr:hypothetical protein [Planctomycetota bacterium]
MRWPYLTLALALTGCAAKPEAIGTRALSGSWRSAEGAILEIEDTGVMMLQRPGPKQRPVVGAYTFDGTEATFRDQPGSNPCSDGLGTYTLQVEPNAFTAAVVRDPCQDRQKILVGAWTRVGAARVTPDS